MIKKATPKKKEVAEPIKRKNLGGRPTEYTDELAIEFCEELKNFDTIEACCKSKPYFPVPSTIYKWNLEKKGNGKFSELLKEANDCRYSKWAEDCVKIADDDSRDAVDTPFGLKYTGVTVSRDKLRIDTRLRLLAKLKPEIFGDKAGDETKEPEKPQGIDEINQKINYLLAETLKNK